MAYTAYCDDYEAIVGPIPTEDAPATVVTEQVAKVVTPAAETPAPETTAVAETATA